MERWRLAGMERWRLAGMERWRMDANHNNAVSFAP
jgi:hypothetical protein